MYYACPICSMYVKISFDFEIYHLNKGITSNHHNNTRNGFIWQNPMKKRYYTLLYLALFVKNHI